MHPKPTKIVISGGGTGGHIFPAIAIADSVRQLKPDADILFIGAQGRMEMDKVPQAGYSIKGLWISGLQRKMSFKNLSFPFKLLYSLFKAYSILRKYKPNIVVGVGGYASGPTLRAALWLNIPTLIQEQNSYPGITNKLLGRKVNRICVAYDNMEKWFPKEKIVQTGNPLRKAAVDIGGKTKLAHKFFELKEEKTTVLVVGGSQGAKTINLTLNQNLKQICSEGIQLIWQTGKTYYNEAKEVTSKAGLKDAVKPVAFINRMDLAYAAADIIVSRAGAMAISEIAVVGKPVIFIPFPFASEDHQTKNAKRLVLKKAALLVENKDVSELLLPTIISLSKNKQLQNELAKNISQFAITDASENIAKEILELV